MAVTPAAWQTEKMKKYAQDVPAAAVARDQLEVSVAEFSTHENQRVTKVLNDALQAVLTGSKRAAGADGRPARSRPHTAFLQVITF